MKLIIVTGSVGTGKTTLSKKLAEKLNFIYVDANKIIKKYNLSENYDKKRKTKIVDIERLNKALIKEINKHKKSIKNGKINKKGIIIDSHLSHYLSKKYVDLCIVTKCNLKELEKRLKKRKYPMRKIRENLDAEIFDICLNEAKDAGHKTIVIGITKNLNISVISKNLK